MSTKKKNEESKSTAENTHESEKVHIHTTIDQHTYTLLKRLSLNTQYGNISRALEQAITLLAIRSKDPEVKPSDLDEYQLANLMRNQFEMISVGRRTFLSYIDTLPDKPMNDNIAKELIEWYTGKGLHELNIETILNAIKRMWKAANYFRDVTIEPVLIDNAQKFKVIFQHNFEMGDKYGEYWSKYFQRLFELQDCKVEREMRNEMFYLFITTKRLK